MLELRETEAAHHEAVQELARMKETMEKMEIERAEMVAEVEAQIERALASMAVDLEESDYTASRPQSRLSSASGLQSRRSSDAGAKNKALRSFATDSTLAEKCEENHTENAEASVKDSIPENTELEPSPPPRKKRFSASEVDIPQDGMNAVDEGISLKSDKIAQKVMEIQQKVNTHLVLPAQSANRYPAVHHQLESALSQERRGGRRRKGGPDSDDDESEATSARPLAKKKHHKRPSKISTKSRTRSGTSSSTHTGVSTAIDDGAVSHAIHTMTPSTIVEPESKTPTRTSFSDVAHRDFSRSASEIEPLPSPDPLVSQQLITPTTPALTPGAAGTTDESDTDFQSAYSTSPRDSYGQFDPDTQEEYQDITITTKSPEYQYTNTHSMVKPEGDGDLENTGSTPTISC